MSEIWIIHGRVYLENSQWASPDSKIIQNSNVKGSVCVCVCVCVRKNPRVLQIPKFLKNYFKSLKQTVQIDANVGKDGNSRGLVAKQLNNR